MKPVVGIFHSATEARRAAERLGVAGVPYDRITVVAPGASLQALEERVPTSDTEQPGIGTAIGGVVGVASAASLGTAALLAVPGVGTVGALGILAATLLGVGGAAAGAAVGHAVEESLDDGVPRDELFFYEEALREGHTVVVALAASDTEADRAGDVMTEAGAESLDAARERWWIGLRDGEAREERAAFADERAYRLGFEAALRPETRGRRYDEIVDTVRRRCPDVYGAASFHRGFERGQAYLRRRGAAATPITRTGT